MVRVVRTVKRRRGKGVMGRVGMELEMGMEIRVRARGIEGMGWWRPCLRDMGGGTLVRMRKRNSKKRESPKHCGTTRRHQRTTWAGVRAVIGLFRGLPCQLMSGITVWRILDSIEMAFFSNNLPATIFNNT
jgi:hypothetical protein